MKEIRCFIENASLASPATQHVSEIYELSEQGKTFAKSRERMVVKGDDRNMIHSFHVDESNSMTEADAKVILKVVGFFIGYLETVVVENKKVINTAFTKIFNNAHDEFNISMFNYNILITHDSKKYPDYITFQTDKLSCSVWLSDKTFKLFYPLYDIDVVTPFEDFDKVIKSPTKMVSNLEKYDQAEFSKRRDDIKNGIPSTYSPAVNIPYVPKKGLKPVDCWFGFNIYGAAGNYDYLMREALYDYLKDLGLSDEFIEEHFPTIFEVNEFFIVPEWCAIALPSRVAQGSINTHVNLAFDSPFLMPKFVKAYDDSDDFMRKNTYNVPLAYNNLLCRVLNGKYTEKDKQDFRKYYEDLLTVNSTNPDFARMSQKTQRFLIMLSYMVDVSDSVNTTELFNKLMSANYMVDNKVIKFSLTARRGVTYISTFYDKHRYYMVPRYEFTRITNEK